MAEINDWDVAASGNGFTVPNGFPEGMNYSQVNNAAREVMAVTRRWEKDSEGALVTTGASNTYVLVTARVLSAYANGQCFKFRANHTCNGASTINVGSVGPVALVTPTNAALVSGAITSGGVYDIAYSSAFSCFVLLGSFSTLAGEVVAQGNETTRGTLELGTAAETLTGSDGTRPPSIAALTALFNAGGRRTIAATGYQKLPGGLIFQWGRTGDLGDISGDSATTASFATAFPTAVLGATATPYALAGGPGSINAITYWDQSATTTSAIAFKYNEAGGSTQTNWGISFMAIGY